MTSLSSLDDVISSICYTSYILQGAGGRRMIADAVHSVLDNGSNHFTFI
jgi:hypothetical protein